MRFYVGMHHPSVAHHLERCMVSYQRLRTRRSDFRVGEWMLDSGAFTEVARHGGYRDAPDVYAAAVARWATCGQMVAAVSQDYMCEPFVLAKTGMTIAEHQRLTIERYDALRLLIPPAIHLMPVLQGYLPEQYVAHISAYGARLHPGMWVGVGSICRRNGNSRDIAAVLRAIHQARPDVRLHGFGVKTTALRSLDVRAMLWSADSMAWSFSARRQGRDANDWREAAQFAAALSVEPAAPVYPLDLLWEAV